MTNPTLTYFAVTGYFFDVESALPGGTTSALQFEPLSAFVSFYPRVPAGFTARVDNLDFSGTPHDTALAIAPVLGRIYEGKLSTIDQSDTAEIKLLANSAAISSEIALVSSAGLIYDVCFTDVTYAGAARVLTNFAFTAPVDTTAVNLTDPTLTRLTYAGPGA